VAVAVGLVAVVAVSWYGWRRYAVAPGVLRTADQNVLLITIDTLRADALGCYGGAAATPALDRLAASGTRYTFAHAHAPVTLVSHASILAGVYPFQHGIRDNSGFRFPASLPTLATRLQKDGFATGAFIGAFPLHSQFGLGVGFDVYDESFKETGLPIDFAMSERPATAVVAAARPWIARQRGRWFAWVHVFDPHAPYRPPEPFASQYAANPYAGEVAATDAALAPLLNDVRERRDRPTLVIVTGDHGEALGDHGEQTHGVFAYESTLRVPLMIAQSGGARGEGQSGAISDDPVRHIDIVPTVLDATGDQSDPLLPGRSLLASAPSTSTPVSYFEALSPSLNRGWAPLTGVIVGREKFTELPLPELYDLAADPGERQNLIDRKSERRRALEAHLRSLRATASGERREENSETTARLNALGYLSGGARHRGPYTENDDPKRLIDLDRKIHDAIDLFQRGQGEQAVAQYRDVIVRRPDMAIAYEQLAFVQSEMGRLDEAIATLRQALAKGVSDATIESKLGMYLAESGRAREGLPWLERAARRPSPDLDTLNALAIGYARTGSPDRAIATFHRVIEHDAGNAMAWQNIGSVELGRGNAAAARDAFHRALEADANWAAAYTGLGVAEQRLHNFDAAITSWKRAVELDPRQFDALYNLATELASAGRSTEARVYAERFVQTAPPTQYKEDIRQMKAFLR
jgi:arylsulfatase A-like enzyme/Tfp pilus assembly protein PilF